MQNSETCMFCRYRKARIAACCAGHAAVPAPQESTAQAAMPPPTGNRERALAQAPRQETADAACP